MSLSSWFPWKLGRQHKGRSRPADSPRVPRRGTRLAVEQLEDRCVPSVATVPELIAAINLANSTPVADTIELRAGTTFTLTQVNNGSNGLPVIAAAGGPLTILGNGATIERSSASGTPSFRLLNVAAGASLTLSNVTVQGGKGTVAGGGIYSSGSLTLQAGTIIRDNQAIGRPAASRLRVGEPAYGGGVYVAAGTATLTDVTLSSNDAQGGSGRFVTSYGQVGWTWAGSAYGGGMYVAAGTATMTGVTLSSNSARGGYGTAGGAAYGGGVSAAGGGAVTLTSSTLTSNSALGGGGNGNVPPTARGGPAYGGGVYVAGGGTVTLIDVTLSSNSAVGGGFSGPKGKGGPGTGYGGGVYVAGGTATLTDVILSSNSAKGGANPGSNSMVGFGYGGGVYAQSGTVTLRNATVTDNSALDGAGKTKYARGGGLYIWSASSLAVYLDAFTVTNTTDNTPDDIFGPYTLL